MVIDELTKLVNSGGKELRSSTKRDFPFVIAMLVPAILPFSLAIVTMGSSTVTPDFTFSTRDASRGDMLTRSLLRLLGLRLHGHHCGNTVRSVTGEKAVGTPITTRNGLSTPSHGFDLHSSLMD